MRFYVNSAASSACLSDIKSLIPDANMRRRMSSILKMGVGTAMESLYGTDPESIDAIITATGLGCLEDSEKFLRSVIENNEQLLNPTPFIQSTFNTIGGQIALITGNHCYNTTYSHRYQSFESGLIDALMLLEEGNAKTVLLGAADETTPTQALIMERMGLYRGGNSAGLGENSLGRSENSSGRNGNLPGQGAHFFVISSEPAPDSLGVIEGVYIDREPGTGNIETEIVADKSYHTATAEAVYRGLKMLPNSTGRIVVSNGNIKIVLECI